MRKIIFLNLRSSSARITPEIKFNSARESDILFNNLIFKGLGVEFREKFIIAIIDTKQYKYINLKNNLFYYSYKLM